MLQVELDQLEQTTVSTWEALVEPLEKILDRLSFVWGTVRHLMSVRNTAALRAAHDAVQPDIVRFSIKIGQSRVIFDGLRALQRDAAWDELEPVQRRIVETLIRDARHGGVELEGEERERFNEIQLEQAKLSTQFSNNVLDATKAFALDLTSSDETAGLPESWLELAADSSRRAGIQEATTEKGPWRLTLDVPSLFPFLKYAERRDLRKQTFVAHVTRASSDDLDNTDILRRILQLRKEKAGLLGYEQYADLSLASKMANSVAEVDELSERLLEASYETAQRETECLRQLATDNKAVEADDFRQWDVAFWAERLRQMEYDFSDEELRPFFSFEGVLSGLFALVERLYSIRIEAADGHVPLWNVAVRFFRVFDESDHLIAEFFLDPYTRPAEKRGGAWMLECRARSRALASGNDEIRLPLVYLVCNQTPPVGNKPSLMTFAEVTTLFHEFGHALHTMLTQVDYSMASGINNVEWDAVELPSTFMENWCYHPPTLRGLSRHYETGEPLPDDLIEKIRASKVFRAGSSMLLQLGYGMTDMALHSVYDPNGKTTPFDIAEQINQRTSLLPPLIPDRRLCTFTHAFAGGYAAGYYSYKWAEVLSSDAFGAFEEAGLEDEEEIARVGKRFKNTVLALGGSRHAKEVYRMFRGRDATIDALLRHSGLDKT